MSSRMYVRDLVFVPLKLKFSGNQYRKSLLFEQLEHAGKARGIRSLGDSFHKKEVMMYMSVSQQLQFIRLLLILQCLVALGASGVFAQGTAQGEIEGRAAPVARRMCLAGANAGGLCNEDADCPGATCRDRNIVNISVAVHYDAPAADFTTIENMVSAGSAILFDVSDGQVEIGQATIHNNSAGTTRADIRVYPATCTGGTQIGNGCATSDDCADTPGLNDGRCGVWWMADTGSWRTGGSVHVSMNYINAAGGDVGRFIGHELSHLLFDVRDEYESRPGCGAATGNANCPHAASGQTECLMDSNQSEFCWGQGDPTDLTDMTGGNHDATNITEQSQCRNNRSCWEQVVWAWPNTILAPAGAPDPAANGAVVDSTHFVNTSDTVRVVLVLDESGSMNAESPKRIDRLKVAAKNFKWVCSLLNHAPQVVVVHQSKFYGEQGRNLQPVPSTDRTITLGSSSYVD